MTNGGNGQPEGLGGKIRLAWDLQPLVVPFLAILLSFIIGGVLISVIGVNPFVAYWSLVKGMVGSPDRLAGSIARSVPFVGSALSLAFAFKAGLFNIGAEGQLLVGGITAGWVGTWAWMANVPAVVAVPVIIIAGVVGGLIWGFIPGFLRAETGAHEVITTIMLNSIALFGTRWLVNSRDPIVLRDTTATVPRTATIADSAIFPEFFDSQPNLHFGLILLVAAAVATWWVFRKTTIGFEIDTVGTSPTAAHYAGMPVKRLIILAMAVSGAFAGLSGASEIAGTNQFFQPGTFMLMGFDGIAIALLARANPLAILPASLLWGSLLAGAPLMQQEADVSIDVVRIILAMVLLFVAADAIVRYIFRVKSGSRDRTLTMASGWSGS